MARPKNVEHFRISTFLNPSGTKSWKVSGTMPDGTRIRKNFQTETDAIRERVDLEMKVAGQPETRRALRTVFTPAQLADAESAAQQAGSAKLSGIVAHYVSLRDRARGKGVELDQAIAFVEARYRPETREISVYNAVQEFLAAKVDIAPKTLTNYNQNLKALLKPDPNKSVHAFTITDIERMTGRLSNLNSRKTLRRIISIFFNWAERHHYCLENPCDRLDRLPKDSSSIAILSLDEVKLLLLAAMTYQDGVAAAPVAISLFCGLRPSELEALSPEDIRKDTIIVRGGKMRRSGNRRVPLPENLKVWLEEFPFKGLPQGWDYKMKQLKVATKAKRWVQDILRHTSISHQAERDRNEGETAFNNGTTKQMMDRHYRELIDDEETIAEFWKLTPAAIRKANPKVELPSAQKVAWPTKALLKKLVWQKPLIHAAKDIGVSDVALKKHCVKLGIDLPKQGHWLR